MTNLLPSKQRRFARVARVAALCVAWGILACSAMAAEPPVMGKSVVRQTTEAAATIEFSVAPGDGENFEVVVVHGPEDAGETVEGWAKKTDALTPDKTKGPRDYTLVLDGLNADTDYFYRVKATSAAGTAWSASGGFRTAKAVMPWYFMLGYFVLFVVMLVLPFVVGNWLAGRWRMPDYGWKVGVILFVLLWSVYFVSTRPLKLGIDLSGGVVLVYELDESKNKMDEAKDRQEGQAKDDKQAEAEESQPLDKEKMDKLVSAITMRVDPGGTRNIDIRTYGRNQIEVTIPRANPLEVRRIREKISSAGSLEFRILADRHDPRSTHKTLIAQAAETDAEVIMNTDGSETLGWWVRVAPGEEASFADDPNVVTRKANYRGKQVLEVLVLNDPYNVTGDRLSFCTASYDDKGQPCVKFNFDRAGGNRFGQFTGENKPLEEGAQELFRKLGIILNDELFSAPQLRSQIFGEGEITGRFTQEEVDDLVDVLNAGSLPTALKPNPLFEQESGPSLGRDMIRRGAIATGLSLLAVVFCMTFYYRFAGVVASAAVVMNLLMLLAVMDVIKGFDLTLPGIAGLVLSVGMAVDANVLIFERMREELTRGATLRMAIRNGFDRAMSVIIDSNLTGLITAVILYAIGTSQIRGFAATLGLGIVFSLFTAVFCSHVVFDVGERRGWIKKLSMRNWVKPTQFDFMGRLSTFGVGLSLTLLVIGLFAVVGRGKGLLDIDFTGGESVQILFQKPQRIDNVRRTLLDARNADGSEVFPDLMVWDTNIHGEASGMRFIVNTSKTVDDAAAQKKSAVKIVEEDLANLFKGELATNQLSFGKIQAIELETPEAAPPAATPAAPPADETTKPAANEQSRNDLPPSSLVTSTDPSVVLLAQAEPADQPPPAAAPAEGVMETAPVRDRFAGGSRVDLNFELALDHDTVKELVGSQLAKVGLGAVAFELRNDHYAPGDSNAYENWTLRIQLPEDELKEKVIEPIDEQLAATPYFPSSSSIGGKVAGDMQEKAIIAILLSLLCVVAYLWVRFQHISYGLATVLALVHDVLITLGAVAVTAYIYPVVDTMKIGLTVLAAFLTIIGYSLNDTIVVFDRIREVKGKLPYLNKTTINASINQTLSRTLLTGMTTLFVLIILFYGGGSGLHAFAYTLLIGIITGTYSSVFVATPLLYWMTGRGKAQGASKAA